MRKRLLIINLADAGKGERKNGDALNCGYGLLVHRERIEIVVPHHTVYYIIIEAKISRTSDTAVRAETYFHSIEKNQTTLEI